MTPIDRTPPSSWSARILPTATAVGTDRHPQQGRALIVRPAKADGPRSPAPVNTGGAAFLAQLIAVDQHLPQTRARRRADPEDARAAYAAIRQFCADIPGRAVSRIA